MLYVFFFFQAEDGIRDKLVTGVQTCALPILAGDGRGRCRRPRWWYAFGSLCFHRNGNHTKRERADECTRHHTHGAGSGRRRSRVIWLIVAAIESGSRQRKSPSAMKSAPAATSGATSSTDAAKPTHGISKTSAHQATRSSIAALAGPSPSAVGSPNIT